MEYARQNSTEKQSPAVTTTTASPDLQPLGNAAAQAELAEQGGSLYDELRERLGNELAELITENLSEEELLGHVDPLIDDLIERVKGLTAGQELPLSEEQLGGIFTELDTKLTQGASDLLDRLNLDSLLANFAQDNPELVAAVALAGVVAWALKTNPDIPALKGDTEMGNHTLGGELDLGPVLDLTIQHIEAQWAYSGEQLSANMRAFGGEREGGWGVEGGAAYDGARTDASIEGDYRSTDAGDQWNLAAMLAHDGKTVDGELAANASGGPDGTAWDARGALSFDGARTDGRLEGSADHTGAWNANALLTHDGARTDGRLEGSADHTGAWSANGLLTHDGKRTDGRLEGSADHTGAWNANALLTHDGKHTDGRLEGSADHTGAWNAAGSLNHENGDRRWSLLASGGQDAAGERSGQIQGSWQDTHEHFRSSAQGQANLDGAWSLQGGLVGLDEEAPWSLTASAGRTAADAEADWSLQAQAAGYLDDNKQLRLSGSQVLGPDQSVSRMELGYTPSEAVSASAWMERSRTAAGDLSAFGGEFKGNFNDMDAYARGFYRSDQTWEAAAGISSGTDSDAMSWFAEGYTNRNELGQQDHGARAGLRIRF